MRRILTTLCNWWYRYKKAGDKRTPERRNWEWEREFGNESTGRRRNDFCDYSSPGAP